MIHAQPEPRRVIKGRKRAATLLLAATLLNFGGPDGTDSPLLAAADPNLHRSIVFRRCMSSIVTCNAADLVPEVTCGLLAHAITTSAGTALPENKDAAGDTDEAGVIPRLLHQSWKTNLEIPAGFRLWAQTWRDLNTGWQHRLWSDRDNRQLVENHYPWLLRAYDGLPRNIMRADTSRYLYMHRMGGVYADLDTVCLRPMESLLKDAVPAGQAEVAVLAKMSADEAFEHNIPNAWMASTPGHPFWLFVAGVVERRAVAARRTKLAHLLRKPQVEMVTGPIVLKNAYETWRCTLRAGDQVTVLDPGYIYVGDWHNLTALDYYLEVCSCDDVMEKPGRKKCLGAFPNAHVLTYWTHSWDRRRRRRS